MENGVSIGWILGTALTVFLMDYFKLFSEEGKKNKKFIWKVIRFSFISLCVTILYIVMDMYTYKTHLYREFTENDIQIYTITYFVNLLLFLILNKFFNWVDVPLKKIIIFFRGTNSIFRVSQNLLRCVLVLIFLSIFVKLVPKNSYKVFQQDVIVENANQTKFIAKANQTTFDLIYQEKKGEIDTILDEDIDFKSKDTNYLLQKGTKIKILKDSFLYPVDNASISLQNPSNENEFANIIATNDSIAILNKDKEFTLDGDVLVQLSEENKLRFNIEAQIPIIFAMLSVFYFIRMIFEMVLSLKVIRKIESAEEVGLDELIEIYMSNEVNIDKLYNKECFKNDLIPVRFSQDEWKINYCVAGDIIIDTINYKAAIVSDATAKCMVIADNYLLVKYNKNKITTNYLYFIIMQNLENESISNKIIDKNIKNIKIKLPSKFYQYLIGKEFELFQEEKYKYYNYYSKIKG